MGEYVPADDCLGGRTLPWRRSRHYLGSASTDGSPIERHNIHIRSATSGQRGDRNYRITHFNDLVPIVPSFGAPWYFRHVEPEYSLKKGPSSRVDYKPRDLDECRDWKEKHCIQGFIGYGLGVLTNRLSHGYYLTAISQCGKPCGSAWAADELFCDSMAGEELMASLRDGFERDIKYAASLHNNSLLGEYRWTGWQISRASARNAGA